MLKLCICLCRFCICIRARHPLLPTSCPLSCGLRFNLILYSTQISSSQPSASPLAIIYAESPEPPSPLNMLPPRLHLPPEYPSKRSGVAMWLLGCKCSNHILASHNILLLSFLSFDSMFMHYVFMLQCCRVPLYHFQRSSAVLLHGFSCSALHFC